MKLGISEILKLVEKENTIDKRVEVLRKHDSTTLRTLLKYAFDKETKFDLPSGIPPYKKCDYPGQQGNLYGEMRRMYLFLEGGNPNLNKIRREFLFIQLLENLDPADADLMCHIKDKKLPYKGITVNTVKKAFPNLI